MNKSIVIILAVCLVSCNLKNETKKDNVEITGDSLRQDTANISKSKDLDFLPPFDVMKLKQEFEDMVTSTFVSNSDSKIYARPKEKGYYGKYYLSKYYEIDNEVYMSGSLTIFNDSLPWIYDNKSDIFIELTAEYPGIFIFDKIEVGSDISLVDDYLGKPFFKKDNITIYNYVSTHLIALFKIENNKIMWFRCGYYSDEVINNIEKHLPSLLK